MTDETIDILDAMPDALTIINIQGEILHINAAATLLWGYSKEEVIGKMAAELFVAEIDKPEFIKTFKSLHSDCVIKSIRFTGRHKDGTIFPVLVSLSVIKDANGFPVKVVATNRNITKPNIADEEINKLHAQSNQSRRLETIGRLVCVIAHDFSKIVTAINNFSQLGMKEFQKSVPHAYDIFSNIKAVSGRATNLTRQLLTFQHNKSEKLNIIDMNSLINDLKQMLFSIINDGVGIKLDMEANLHKILGDIGKMEQVIMNLVINAKDAMPQGGTIEIKTGNVEINTAHNEKVPDEGPGRYIQITVKDHGTGIKKDHLKHIFEPFFTTKNSRDSAGLGLSVVCDIIEDHKGWINVLSEEGIGTTFEIFLPAIEIELDKATEDMSITRGINGNYERILMV